MKDSHYEGSLNDVERVALYNLKSCVEVLKPRKPRNMKKFWMINLKTKEIGVAVLF